MFKGRCLKEKDIQRCSKIFKMFRREKEDQSLLYVLTKYVC